MAMSTRLAPAAARSARSRRPMTLKRLSFAANGSDAGPSARWVEPLRSLSLIVPRLWAIYGTAITAELALRQQGAEQSPEIADCLRAGVCDPIADQIRALEEVIGDWPEASGSES